MFKCVTYVPGLSLKHLFQTLDIGQFFSLIDPANQEKYFKIEKNVAGGHSLFILDIMRPAKQTSEGMTNFAKKL